jgi:elongation factor Ts
MAVITATLVKILRDRTGAGVIACKKALTETAGDLESAAERLREAERSKAAEKANRVTAEGVVGLMVRANRGAIVEINTETDFVARNEAFVQTAADLAGIALAVNGDREALLRASAPDGDGEVQDLIARMTARTGEHIHVRRSGTVSVGHGVLASYVHNAAAPGVGSIGVLVALESAGDAEQLVHAGRKIAMHVAASAPQWISEEEIPADVLMEKHAELSEQARASGKPPAIVDKMVQGRLRKFKEEVVLGLQPYVLNPEQRVDEAMKEFEAMAGAPIAITSFLRFRTGEGLAKAGENRSQ